MPLQACAANGRHSPKSAWNGTRRRRPSIEGVANVCKVKVRTYLEASVNGEPQRAAREVEQDADDGAARDTARRTPPVRAAVHEPRPRRVDVHRPA